MRSSIPPSRVAARAVLPLSASPALRFWTRPLIRLMSATTSGDRRAGSANLLRREDPLSGGTDGERAQELPLSSDDGDVGVKVMGEGFGWAAVETF